MAFNGQTRHYEMPGAFLGAERDEFGYTEGDYVRMMDDVAATIVEGHDEVPSTQQVGSEERPQYDRNGQRGPTRRPSSRGGARHHPYGDSQQHGRTNPFAGMRNTHPAPPAAWHTGLEAPSQSIHQDTRPSPFSDYGVACPNVGHNPPPYTANAASLNPPSRPKARGYPNGQSLQAQAGPSESGRPTGPVVVDEDEIEDHSSEDEEGGEEVEGTNGVKDTKKSNKASKGKYKARRGLTRTNADGQLEWLARADSEGVLAVTHDDIRPQLIAIAEAERVALGVQNEYQDVPGPGRYNVTSFYHKHVQWGPDREDRPEIDFQWEEDKAKNPRPKCPGYMYWEGNGRRYIVLDPHDNPVKDWDLPAAIASNIPGYKLEAMRRENMSLGHKDFWARMPRRINVGTEDHPDWEELGTPNTVVNMPMERFRFHAGLCSWTERKLTLTIKAGLQKLYGDKLQNNTIRGFGRDLTTKEVKEIKKGEAAVFPIKGDAAAAVRRAAKKPKSSSKLEKAQSRKRKHTTDDEEQSSEEEAPAQNRPQKRARHRGREDSIAAEVDDLVMFDQTPTIIDDSDTTRRYPRRSVRTVAKAPENLETIEEVSGESSANGEYEGVPTQRRSPKKPRAIAKARGNSKKVERLSCESSVETDEEEVLALRSQFRRIPRPGEVGGKSKGPSWVSSTGEEGQSNEKQDHRRTAVPVNIDGRTHYATYEGLISNEPPKGIGASGTLSLVSSVQHESYAPQPHPFEMSMSMPILEENVEYGPLQAHRKRVNDFLVYEEIGVHAPPSKRVRMEEPAIEGATSNFDPKVDQSGRVASAPHAVSSLTQKQKLEAEWAQVFEGVFLDLGFQSVNYSEVEPWNEQEVQSLIDALLPTREVYFAWTGEPAPKTDPQLSYRAQYDTIFWSFQDWWREHRPVEALPILTGVMHWGRSVFDWEPPSKDSIYYEAFKKGHRAPCGENGQMPDLRDWSGARFEDDFRRG